MDISIHLCGVQRPLAIQAREAGLVKSLLKIKVTYYRRQSRWSTINNFLRHDQRFYRPLPWSLFYRVFTFYDRVNPLTMVDPLAKVDPLPMVDLVTLVDPITHIDPTFSIPIKY